MQTAPNDPIWWLTAERDANIAKRSNEIFLNKT
jgi:hypothetical protein